MRKWALFVVAVAAVLGVIVATISVSQHIRIQREGLEKASFCAISEKINCDIINASSYAEYLGMPTAAWGASFYLLVVAISLICVVFKKQLRSTVFLLWLMSCAGIALSAYLAHIAVNVLGVVCIECLAMYLINILIFVFLFVALKIPIGGFVRFVIEYIKAIVKKPTTLEFKPYFGRHAMIFAAFFLACWIVMQAVSVKAEIKNDVSVDEKVRAFYMQSLHTVEPEPGWQMWGNPEAKVTVVEFSEFQCPFCKTAAFNVRPRLAEFKDKIRFYFVNYPLDQACNADLERPMHKYACFAAKAGICAAKRGDFWGFHDELFRNQRGIDEEKILAIAQKHDWDKGEFSACIASSEVEEQVKTDLEVGRRAHIDGTPAIFVNNRMLRYWSDAKFLQTIIAEEIKKAEK